MTEMRTEKSVLIVRSCSRDVSGCGDKVVVVQDRSGILSDGIGALLYGFNKLDVLEESRREPMMSAIVQVGSRCPHQQMGWTVTGAVHCTPGLPKFWRCDWLETGC
jgi:hypothetical protein